MGIAKIDVNAEETYWHADAAVAGDFVFTSYQAGEACVRAGMIRSITSSPAGT